MSLKAVFVTGARLDADKLANLSIKAGGQTSVVAGLGGSLYIGGSFSNVGTSLQAAFSKTLPASLLLTNEQAIQIEGVGVFAANANNKQFQLIFGTTTVFDTGLSGFNDRQFRYRFHIVRTGAATQLALGMFEYFTAAGGTVTALPLIGGVTETLSGALALTINVRGGASADVLIYPPRVTWLSEGN